MKSQKTHWNLLFALIAGILFGTVAHSFSEVAWLRSLQGGLFDFVGQVFLRLIFMIVMPLIFSALVLGVYDLGAHSNIGRVAGRTLIYTLIASSLSVLIGITLVEILRPGKGVVIDSALLQSGQETIQNVAKTAQSTGSIKDILLNLIPKNPLEAAVNALNGQMLALMVFALILGYALSKTQPRASATKPTFLKVLEELYDACLMIMNYAMKLAPLAVFCIVFGTAFKMGPSFFVTLALYVGTVILGLLLQQFGIYSFLLKTIAKVNPWKFYAACKDVYLYAFTTSSSNVTLPKSLELAETKLGLPPEISRFVLTVGATANQNGTALFEGITVLFLAQVYSIDLTLLQQVEVVLMSILAGVGTAGVPGGSLPLIALLLQSVGIPVEGLALILGVDRFLDMSRTVLNVSGDLVIATLVSAGEKKHK